MVIIIHDYSWRQTEEQVFVHVPLKGVHCSKVDVFTTSSYIKAAYHPFLFELFLSAPINMSESKCVFIDEEIIFELQKEQSGTWETLQLVLDKNLKIKHREMSIEKAQTHTADVEKTISEIRTHLQKLSVRKQIELDSSELSRIENIKTQEKAAALKDIAKWKQNTTSICSAMKIEKYGGPSPTCDRESAIKRSSVQQNSPSRVCKGVPTRRIAKAHKIDPAMYPFPRRTGNIKVLFTSRAFPTPSRESKAPEEEEWLKKQLEARRSVGFVAEDLTPEEQDPTSLKDRGDAFYRVRNYLGAISAYSHAISLGSTIPALYANRSAAHMAVGNYHKTVEDCTKALELLTPCVPANRESRARCLARRGTALCVLGASQHGVVDLEAALKLDPDNHKLREDLQRAISLQSDNMSDESD